MRLAALAVLALALSTPVEAQLVDTTAPGPLETLTVMAVAGRAEVEALLPGDDDVTQVRLRLLDADGKELSRHYAPAGPGERVHLALPLPPDAALLAARVADGAGNPGPEAEAPVDGSLRTLSLQREVPAPAWALLAVALALLLLRR